MKGDFKIGLSIIILKPIIKSPFIVLHFTTSWLVCTLHQTWVG